VLEVQAVHQLVLIHIVAVEEEVQVQVVTQLLVRLHTGVMAVTVTVGLVMDIHPLVRVVLEAAAHKQVMLVMVEGE
jgi:hypothetical protein